MGHAESVRVTWTIAPFLIVPAAIGLDWLWRNRPELELPRRPERWLPAHRFEVTTLLTTGEQGSYVTRVRGRTMQEAWSELIRSLDQPDPHQVVKLRVTGPLDWKPQGRPE